MKILVAGATGMLGSTICRHLAEQGHEVRALTRAASPVEAALRRHRVEIARGDLKDRASIEAACRGMEAVISTATCIVSKRAGDTLKAVDRDGQVGLVEAAKRAGASRFIFVSAAHEAGWTCPFLDFKRMVENALRHSGIAWTILRPGPFMETQFSPMMGWDLAAGKARVVGNGKAPVAFISLEDVAAFAARAAQDERMARRILHLGGPETLTPLDAVRRFEEAAGRGFQVTHVPLWALKVLRVGLRPFRPDLSSIATLGLLSSAGWEIDMRPLQDEFGMDRLMSVREYAERATRPIKPAPIMGEAVR